MEIPEEGLWLIGRVSRKLLARNMTMCTAESCTGGLAAALCTGVPGSSRWFCGSIVAYADSVKTRLLGVSKVLLTAHGAVSGPVAEAMALGALAATGAASALAVTGIAGPGGGSAEKPVGTVWFATAVYPSRNLADHPQGPAITSFCRTFSGYRDEVRLAAALAGLEAVETALAHSHREG
ncbi:MAG: nicotinamide-nucleotide amidohydrolase family protein [Desulfovibrio sp.]|jgi:nicotinamide-nucleotide amidase|nr:nicotinamide-nucleotide amidohydrolase family protein [Desulfovibrio sp.]